MTDDLRDMTPPPPPRPRIAFQGELGAFSEEAVHRFFGEDVEPIPCRDFAEVGRRVVAREVDYGILPIENSLAGSVVGSYDVLAGGQLEIIGEVITPIHHCILGHHGTTLESIRRIFSHPVALAQCTRILGELPHVEAVAVYDTAGAAKDVAAQDDRTLAAIAGERAAARYGLEVIARNVEDRPDNQTRFFAVRRAGGTRRPIERGTDRATAMKSAVLLETPNTPGALLRVLAPFGERGINLSKLESRPAGEPWSYRFFLEFDADASDPAAVAALEEVRAASLRTTLLGTFPRIALD